MEILTILLFIILCWGLGFGVTFFVKNSENALERNLIRLGIGLGVLAFLMSAFTVLRIPIDWKIMLVLAVLAPLYVLVKNKPKLKPFKLTRQNLVILAVLTIFLFTFYMYHTGAFSYPYLEDGDPWEHADSARYIAHQKTGLEPSPELGLYSYIDARPPAYDGIMALMFQASSSGSMIWVLKFFNALMISLAVLFFYFFARRFTGNSYKALIATFFLASIPAFMSHFIWSHSLIAALIFPALYCIEMLKEDKKWVYPAMTVIAGILTTQETQAVKFGIMIGIYVVVNYYLNRKQARLAFVSALGGFALALIFWWIPMVFRYGGIGKMISLGIGEGNQMTSVAGKFIHPSITKIYYGILGSATRQHGIYTFKDFFFAKAENMINSPIGIGVFVSLLVFGALILLLANYRNILKKRRAYIVITFFWLLFTFLGIHGGTHWWSPVALFSFRFWMLFAIPVSLIAAEGVFMCLGFAKKSSLAVKAAIIIFIAVGVIMTSWAPKYGLNTVAWQQHYMQSAEELNGYFMLSQFPKDTMVFSFSKKGTRIVNAFPVYDCKWCAAELEFRKENILEKSAEEIHDFLRERGYKFAILTDLDYRVLEKEHGDIDEEAYSSAVSELQGSEDFSIHFQNPSVSILKVN